MDDLLNKKKISNETKNMGRCFTYRYVFRDLMFDMDTDLSS